MVPESERVTAFLGARPVPAEVEDSPGEMLTEPPSRTAIQHVLSTVGQRAEEGSGQLELALELEAPLDTEGDTLVVTVEAGQDRENSANAKRQEAPCCLE